MTLKPSGSGSWHDPTCDWQRLSWWNFCRAGWRVPSGEGTPVRKVLQRTKQEMWEVWPGSQWQKDVNEFKKYFKDSHQELVLE